MDIHEVIKAALRSIKADPTQIDAGTYVLDGTRVIIDLRGTLTKGAEEWHVPTTSVPLIASIALALHSMGIQEDLFLEKLEVSMTAALAMDDQAEAYVDAFNKKVAATTAKVHRSMKSLPPRKHEGKILPKVQADVVFTPGPALVSTAVVPVPTT